jgi:hypothetical protein
VGASLALAACTSGSPAPAAGGAGQSSAGQSGVQALRVPVKNGTVVVKQGNKIICVMKVVNGKGTCKVPANSFGVGTAQIVASYSGKGYGSSQSAPLSYTVAPATTATTLTLSVATVTYGHEQAGHLSVKVTARYAGTPAGTVAVKDNGATVCVIRLSAATGACTLPATRLSVGIHALTAVYAGDHWRQGSASAVAKLTVLK